MPNFCPSVLAAMVAFVRSRCIAFLKAFRENRVMVMCSMHDCRWTVIHLTSCFKADERRFLPLCRLYSQFALLCTGCTSADKDLLHEQIAPEIIY